MEGEGRSASIIYQLEFERREVQQPRSESWRRVREKFCISVKSAKLKAVHVSFTSMRGVSAVWELDIGWGLINMVGVLGIRGGTRIPGWVNIATAETS